MVYEVLIQLLETVSYGDILPNQNTKILLYILLQLISACNSLVRLNSYIKVVSELHLDYFKMDPVILSNNTEQMDKNN